MYSRGALACARLARCTVRFGSVRFGSGPLVVGARSELAPYLSRPAPSWTFPCSLFYRRSHRPHLREGGLTHPLAGQTGRTGPSRLLVGDQQKRLRPCAVIVTRLRNQCSNANTARVCWGVGPVGSFLVLKPKFWLFLSDNIFFLLIDCYSLDRTLEIHGAANTKQIQEKCTVASNRANPLGNTQIIALW